MKTLHPQQKLEHIKHDELKIEKAKIEDAKKPEKVARIEVVKKYEK